MEETRTNEQLAIAGQDGDQQAIAQLWKQNKGFMCAWCYRFYECNRDRCAAYVWNYQTCSKNSFLLS